MKELPGQTLIEVLIAFAITVIIGVGLISANLVTQRASQSARFNTQATKLAQDYIEKIRVLRDTNGFSILPANGCYKIDNSDNESVQSWSITLITTTRPCSPTQAQAETVSIPADKAVFYRYFDIEDNAGVEKNITVVVFWNEGINNRSISTRTKLTNWPSI